jgi:hypothetical protein
MTIRLEKRYLLYLLEKKNYKQWLLVTKVKNARKSSIS